MANEMLPENIPRELIKYPKYLIYRDGSIYSLHSNRYLKAAIKKTGYSQISLINHASEEKTVLVHRLVAEAFIPNPLDKPQVNHKDGNKLNNHDTNLEWVTASENQRHAYKNKLNSFCDKDRANLLIIQEGNKKPVIKIDPTTSQILGEFESIKEAGRINGIDYKLIHAVCKGKQKTTYGYKWSYKEGIANGK